MRRLDTERGRMITMVLSNPGDPNYAKEVEAWEGRIPQCKGYMLVGGDQADKWSCKWGGGETTPNGDVLYADFNISDKLQIYICGNTLCITDIRYSGPTTWYYCNDGKLNLSHKKKKNIRELEPERIEKILNTKILNCKFWDLVQRRAKELYHTRG